MDPSEVLKTLRELTAAVKEEDDLGLDATTDLSSEFAEAFGALDEWLSKGGFLPAAWAGDTEATPGGES